MTIKIKRTGLPAELEAAVTDHAAAMAAGDGNGAGKFASDRAGTAHREAMRRAASLRPFNGYEVIARARLGFHYLVKVRLSGDAGYLTVQTRWLRAEGGEWRIAEVDDLGLQSPWQKPAQA
jgi:hypothetical protein